MKRIFLALGTNLAVLLLLGSLILLMERVFGMRLGRGSVGTLLLLAAVCGFGGAIVSLVLSKWAAKRLLGVRVISQPQSESEVWLVETLGRLAERARIGMPEVGVFESPEMNALATGAHRNAALVAVSTGLLRTMPRPQLEAVLGHEVSHIANGDMVTLTLLQGVLNTFVIFVARIIGAVVDRTLFQNDRGESGTGFILAAMVAQFSLGLLAGMIVGWYSRRREFRADRGGATLVGAGSMVGALELLKHGQAEPLPPQMRAFGIRIGPAGTGRDTGDDTGQNRGQGVDDRRWLMRLFMSHPPLDARIAALRTQHFKRAGQRGQCRDRYDDFRG